MLPAGSVSIDRGPLSGVPSSGRFVRRGALVAGAGKRRDRAALHVDEADPLVADVADEQVAGRVERDAVRLPQLRLGRGSTVTREPGHAGAGDRRDDARAGVDAADDVGVALDDEEVAGRVEPDFVRRAERSGERCTAIARVRLLAVARQRRHPPRRQVEPPRAPGVVLAVVERAVGARDDAERIADRRLQRILLGPEVVVRARRPPDAGDGRERSSAAPTRPAPRRQQRLASTEIRVECSCQSAGMWAQGAACTRRQHPTVSTEHPTVSTEHPTGSTEHPTGPPSTLQDPPSTLQCPPSTLQDPPSTFSVQQGRKVNARTPIVNQSAAKISR